MKLVTTADPGGEKPGWTGKVGFVPHIVEQLAPPAANTVAIVCGPPIMIKLTLPVLAKLGFGKSEIYATLENRMKCGLESAAGATRARATSARTARCIRWPS
jgi:NAD(P)H-flavin reductase